LKTHGYWLTKDKPINNYWRKSNCQIPSARWHC